MKKTIKFIKSMFIGKDKVNPWLMGLFWLSTLIIVFTNLIWVNTTEFFAYGSELGNILNNFAIGFVAAFIFYLIDVWWPMIEKRRKYYRIIYWPLRRIEEALREPVVKIVEMNTGITYEDISSIDDEIIDESFKKIDIYRDLAPMISRVTLKRLNYIQYFANSINIIELSIKEINELHYFDEELHLILGDIKNSSFIAVFKDLAHEYQRNKEYNLHGNDYLLENKTNYIKLNRFMNENSILNKSIQ